MKKKIISHCWRSFGRGRETTGLHPFFIKSPSLHIPILYCGSFGIPTLYWGSFAFHSYPLFRILRLAHVSNRTNKLIRIYFGFTMWWGGWLTQKFMDFVSFVIYQCYFISISFYFSLFCIARRPFSCTFISPSVSYDFLWWLLLGHSAITWKKWNRNWLLKNGIFLYT